VVVDFQNKPASVLYIMGTARSGSTILEILLAHGAGVFGAGELTSLIQDGFCENKPCSCGKDCHQCEVWGKVLQILNMTLDEHVEWVALQKKIDWHDGFIRQVFSMVSEQDKKLYRNINSRLLIAIQQVTGCQIVLDSSKYAGRALALARLAKIDIKVICLTRSPAGLMSSFQKPNKDEQQPKSTVAAIIYYCVTLALLRVAILLLRGRVHPLSYESLLSAPDESLSQLEKWAGINLTDARKRLQANQSFAVGHIVTGNRLRKQGEVYFKSGLDDRTPGGFGAMLAVVVMNTWRKVLGF